MCLQKAEMDRLSGLDASFLYLETPAQLHARVRPDRARPEHDAGAGYSFDAMRDEIDRRVRDVPEFTRKLRKVPLGLDHPIWVRDQHFDIERHVHRLALPTPGGYAELAELAGHLAGPPAGPLPAAVGDVGDRGLRGDDGRELIAVFPKMHHATVDGVSGSNLISHLCSLEPDARAAGARRRRQAGRTSPASASCSAAAWSRTVTRPLKAVGC